MTPFLYPDLFDESDCLSFNFIVLIAEIFRDKFDSFCLESFVDFPWLKYKNKFTYLIEKIYPYNLKDDSLA